MHSYKFLLFYAAVALSLALAYYISPMFQTFTGFEVLTQANPVETALAFLVASTVLAYLAFPSMPVIYVAAGYYMDSFSGGAIVLLGSALGGLGAFLLYREHMPPAQADLKQHSAVKIWLTLLGLRLSPIVPAPLVNFFAAVFRVSPLQYMTTTLLGSAPLILFYAQLGRQGHVVLSGQTAHWWQFSGYLGILGFSTLLSAIGPWRSFLREIKQLKDAAVGAFEPLARSNA